MQEIIKVKNLSKVFNKPIRGNGLKGMIKTLFSNKKIKFTAVNNIYDKPRRNGRIYWC